MRIKDFRLSNIYPAISRAESANTVNTRTHEDRCSVHTGPTHEARKSAVLYRNKRHQISGFEHMQLYCVKVIRHFFRAKGSSFEGA